MSHPLLYLDSHESIEMELLLSQLVPTTRTNLNPQYPDIYYLDSQGRQVGWECKQAGEALGSLSDVEEQLMREMPSVDYLGLTIRGLITPTSDGYCQTWQPAKGNERILVKDHVYRTGYKAYMVWTTRLEMCGVVVKEVGDLQGLVIALAGEYESAQKPEYEHATFKRLINTKAWIAEIDPVKARLAKQLMAVIPGVGEDIALSLADVFPDLKTLLDAVESGAEKQVAGIALRSGKRTVGPSVVKALKEAVGI